MAKNNKRQLLFASLLVTLAIIACSSTTILPTQTPLPTYTPYPTLTSYPTLAPTTVASNGIQANQDEAAFTQELASALETEGWEVSEFDDSTLGIVAGDYKYIVTYYYETTELSRIEHNSLWTGKGNDNLTSDALRQINQTNYDFGLATISVDTDGDVWFTASYYFTDSLQVGDFVNYIQWFSDQEDQVVLQNLIDLLE